MRTVKISYKDPNAKGKITENVITSDTNKEVVERVKELTSKGIYSMNIREQKDTLKSEKQRIEEKKKEYLKY